jgi:hypothetical protein
MRSLCVVGALVLVAACSSKSTKNADAQPLDGNAARTKLQVCKPPGESDCMSQTCGGNSPAINAFPVQGFRPDGECSHEGAQLVPASMIATDPKSACEGATLDVDGEEFVGRKAGKVVCKGDQLLGATFEVRGFEKAPGQPIPTARIKIAKIEPFTARNGETRTAYRMENAEVPNEALCDGNASARFRAKLGLKALAILDDLDAPAKDLVIPIRSELYNRYGDAVPVSPEWKLPVPEWFHFACVVDALADRSLYDLATDNVERSRAMLRMFTADYCGGVPVTMRGVDIDWSQGAMLEAQWSERGAICLTQDPRLLHLHGATRELPPNLPPRLQCKTPNCTPDQWVEQIRKCETSPGTWQSLPTCSCANPPCDDRRVVQSWIAGAP